MRSVRARWWIAQAGAVGAIAAAAWLFWPRSVVSPSGVDLGPLARGARQRDLNVLFVTFTRNSLPYLAGNRLAALEPFVELFNDNTVYLRPFGDDDAWRMIEQLEQRSVSKEDYPLGLLIRATGGFAGLMRAGFPLASIPWALASTVS